MKSWLLYITILLAVVVGVWQYVSKFAMPGVEERMVAALSGVHKYLRPGAAIRFVTYVLPDGTNMGNEKLVNNFIHYVLAPVSLNQQASVHTDTTLILAPLQLQKHVQDSITRAADVIWQNADAEYYYALIH
jgi:hypothetical protein